MDKLTLFILFMGGGGGYLDDFIINLYSIFHRGIGIFSHPMQQTAKTKTHMMHVVVYDKRRKQNRWYHSYRKK